MKPTLKALSLSNGRLLLPLLLLAIAPALRAAGNAPTAAPAMPPKKVLFFTKSSGFEHGVIRQTNGQPSFAMGVLKGLGEKNSIEFTESKDGSLFSTEYLAKFDALMFYTTGNLTTAGTDRNPPISPAGLEAFYKAIADGKGFIGLHSASDTFHSPGGAWVGDGEATSRYIRMIGAEFSGHGSNQKTKIIVADAKFPGIAALPPDYGPHEEWYSQKNFAADMHVILVQDPAGMNGFQYVRPPYPATWARMEGKGRVFYTSMGHLEDIWTSAEFQSVLLGGLNWTTGRVHADVTPNLEKVAPKANELPTQPARGAGPGAGRGGRRGGPPATAPGAPVAPVTPPAAAPAVTPAAP
jgi:type 1 glutamine amidotransferase